MLNVYRKVERYIKKLLKLYFSLFSISFKEWFNKTMKIIRISPYIPFAFTKSTLFSPWCQSRLMEYSAIVIRSRRTYKIDKTFILCRPMYMYILTYFSLEIKCVCVCVGAWHAHYKDTLFFEGAENALSGAVLIQS